MMSYFLIFTIDKIVKILQVLKLNDAIFGIVCLSNNYNLFYASKNKFKKFSVFVQAHIGVQGFDTKTFHEFEGVDVGHFLVQNEIKFSLAKKA